MKLAKMPSGEPEIFYTLQGEGASTGAPAIFVRLSTCNLQCTWCDTPYTWNWEGTSFPTVSGQKFKKEDVILELTPAEVLPYLQQYPCTHLVITGGEPMIQQAEVAELIRILPEGWTLEVETNGTLIPDKLPDLERIQFNVSLKLPHSGNPASKALKPGRIRWFVEHPLSYFKFVVASPEDVAVVQALQSEHSIPASKIILMPEGTSSAKLKAHLPTVADLCIEHGYRLSDRLHVHIWGDERAR